MEIGLILTGLFVGMMSGFFGIGGGTILIPVLLMTGFDIKSAVGISVTQMLFSSLYGSWLNYKSGLLDLKDGLAIGSGGFLGALGSGWLVSVLDESVLEIMFLSIIAFAIVRLFSSIEYKSAEGHSVAIVPLILIGAFVGLFSISMGIGGSILLMPILVGLLRYPLKKAVSAGLFFVVFSSISGFISLSTFGHIDYVHGLTVAFASLAGVFLGIKLLSITENRRFKFALSFLYITIFILMLKKVLGV